MKKLGIISIVFLYLIILAMCFRIDNKHKHKLPLDNVVQIKCTVDYDTYYSDYSHNGWQGSGVFIRDDLILTAGHIVHNISSASVITLDGKTYEAISWYLEDGADIGFIEVKTPEREKSIGFDEPELGEKVWAFGNPLGIFPILTQGIISATDAEDGFQRTKDMIVTDTAINPGNSGCPLFNKDGKIVGLCSWGYRGAQGMSYFVKSKIVRLSLHKYFATRALERAK